MSTVFICLFSFLAIIINALPQATHKTGDFPLRRLSPRAAVMFGRYYGRPNVKRNIEYIPPAPENAMSAFIAGDGDTVGTSSYIGEVGADSLFDLEQTEKVVQNSVYKSPSPSSSSSPSPSEDFTTTLSPIEVTEAGPEEVAHPEVAVLVKESVKRRQSSTSKPSSATTDTDANNSKEDDDDDDDDENDSGFWAFKVNNRRQPIYNAFFPITLGGTGGRSKVYKAYDGVEELPSPGSATAIANSFSTGKGGLATSHATSYGDPYISTLLRSGFSFNKNKNVQNI